MRINWSIWAIATLWGLLETAYFGWNLTPHSVPELFADGLCACLYAASVWRAP